MPLDTSSVRADEMEAACYSVTGEAVFVLDAYNHVVTVTNGCAEAMQCTVWTSVDPEPKLPIVVQAESSESVTTRRGSPVGSFTAYGKCE